MQAFTKESHIAKTRGRMGRDYKTARQRVWKREVITLGH